MNEILCDIVTCAMILAAISWLAIARQRNRRIARQNCPDRLYVGDVVGVRNAYGMGIITSLGRHSRTANVKPWPGETFGVLLDDGNVTKEPMSGPLHSVPMVKEEM